MSKKIAHLAALAAIASVSISAHAVTAGITTPATAATSFTVTASTTATAAGYGLKETVTIQLSAGNIAIADYNATANVYGYAVASTKGKGRVYVGKSSGGAIVESTSAAAVPTITEVTTAATGPNGSGS